MPALSRLVAPSLVALGIVVGCTESSPRRPPPRYGGYAVPTAQPPPPSAPPLPRAQSFVFALPELPPPPPALVFQLPTPPAEWGNLGGIPLPPIFGLPTWPGVAHGNKPAPPAGGRGCGVAKVGGEQFLLDCITPAYGLLTGASQYVVRRQAFSAGVGYAGASLLPSAVDHRAEGTEGPMRDQGPVGACTAFSLAAALDHALAASSGVAGNVSVMQIWARYHYPTLPDAVSGNQKKPLAVDGAWPYDKRTACSYYSGPDCDCGLMLGVSCNQPVDSAKLGQLESAGAPALDNVTRLPDGDLNEIKAALAKGQDVWFGMYVDDSIEGVKGANAIVPDGDFRAAGTGHAMLIAGYKTQANGTYFLLHNSWGPNWGDHGYAWIHEKTLATNIQHAYLIDVSTPGAAPAPGGTPTPNKPGEPTPPTPSPGNCPAGTVPDSGLPVCLPACPDGSPRHFNTCPVPGQCPPGKVNIFGFCVTAPQQGLGRDAATGVSHACGAGGCTFVVPYGVLGCASAPACVRSCPAPKYLLTSGPLGFGCAD